MPLAARARAAGEQLGLRPGPLGAVAGAAEQLQVLDVVGTALRPRDDVVDLEVAERERHTAPSALAFLLAEQGVSVRPVVAQLAQVSPPWDVGTVVDLGEDAELARVVGTPRVSRRPATGRSLSTCGGATRRSRTPWRIRRTGPGRPHRRFELAPMIRSSSASGFWVG